MTTYVEWVEPYHNHWEITVTLRLTKEDAIKVQRLMVAAIYPDYNYKSDDDAFRDFIAIHWAHLVES